MILCVFDYVNLTLLIGEDAGFLHVGKQDSFQSKRNASLVLLPVEKDDYQKSSFRIPQES